VSTAAQESAPGIPRESVDAAAGVSSHGDGGVLWRDCTPATRALEAARLADGRCRTVWRGHGFVTRGGEALNAA
jgi:hypothetical protein